MSNCNKIHKQAQHTKNRQYHSQLACVICKEIISQPACIMCCLQPLAICTVLVNTVMQYFASCMQSCLHTIHTRQMLIIKKKRKASQSYAATTPHFSQFTNIHTKWSKDITIDLPNLCIAILLTVLLSTPAVKQAIWQHTGWKSLHSSKLFQPTSSQLYKSNLSLGTGNLAIWFKCL